MYSPKINEDLIPVIYRIAKIKSKRMTQIVNEILIREINKIMQEEKMHIEEIKV